jgi:hypothetical protein
MMKERDKELYENAAALMSAARSRVRAATSAPLTPNNKVVRNNF